MTNYDRVKQLTKEEMAHVFNKLRDNIYEAEWLEWLDTEYDEATWRHLLS